MVVGVESEDRDRLLKKIQKFSLEPLEKPFAFSEQLIFEKQRK